MKQRNYITRSMCILILLSCLLPLPFAQDGDIETKFQRYVRWMKENKSDLWTTAKRIEKLGDSVVPLLKRDYDQLPEMVQVACAKALIELDAFDYGIDKLMDLVRSGKNSDARIKAVNLIGIYGDFELEDQLNEIFENTFHPKVKLFIAKSLWEVSRNPQAKRILKSFLASENNEIRYEAAIALGEIQNVNAAKTVLYELKDEPSLRGRLAKAILDRENLISRYERLLDSQGGAKATEQNSRYPVLEEVVDKIKTFHIRGDQISDLELVDAAVRGMVEQTDVHSEFWDEEKWEEFTKSAIEEAYVGVGIYVDKQDEECIIRSPIYSGPAYKAGIRSWDQVLAVDGWETKGQSMEEIAKHIRGKEGTTIRLRVMRLGWSEPQEFSITRQRVKLPSLFFTMLPSGIGYIRLTQFARNASGDLEDALVKLEKKGMRALILDLRGNGGGWLQSAVEILDKFVNGEKLLVYSEGRHPVKGEKAEYISTDQGTHRHTPMAVLIDGNSASASEIVAGSLQVHKRASIIGTRSYGKGSVQEPLELESRPDTRLKLTISRYYLPDGRSIHNDRDSEGNITQHNGVVPDIEIESPELHPEVAQGWDELITQQVFRQYIANNYSKNKLRFKRLAKNDKKDTSLYPEFETWYKTLNTDLSKNDIRRMLRRQIRQQLADERGKSFACDYVEDVVLQRAIVEMAGKLKMDLEKSKDYQKFAKKFEQR